MWKRLIGWALQGQIPLLNVGEAFGFDADCACKRVTEHSSCQLALGHYIGFGFNIVFGFFLRHVLYLYLVFFSGKICPVFAKVWN